MSHENQRILALLEELLDYTGQLSQVEEDPDLDVDLIAGKCREKLSEIQAIRPGKLAPPRQPDKGAAHNQTQDDPIVVALRRLQAQTYQCLDVLTRVKNRTEEELASLRQTGKAMRAYARSL